MLSFTDNILQHSPLPELSGAENAAERLLLIAHFGADFNIWSGRRLSRYWDAFAEQTKAACYSGPSLWDWWSHMSEKLPTQPRNQKEREELTYLLNSPTHIVGKNGTSVVNIFRKNTPVMVLRVRVLSESYREAKIEQLK